MANALSNSIVCFSAILVTKAGDKLPLGLLMLSLRGKQTTL